MTDLIYCPRKDCACPVLVEQGDGMGSCQSCHYVFCIFCMRAYHYKTPCHLLTGLSYVVFPYHHPHQCFVSRACSSQLTTLSVLCWRNVGQVSVVKPFHLSRSWAISFINPRLCMNPHTRSMSRCRTSVWILTWKNGKGKTSPFTLHPFSLKFPTRWLILCQRYFFCHWLTTIFSYEWKSIRFWNIMPSY